MWGSDSEWLPADWLLGLPLLVEVPGTAWAAVTEANLTDYAGMYLARRAGTGAALVSRLSPLPQEPQVAVRATLPHDSPWRAVLIADQPEKLIESDLLLNLNAPCAIKDTSWIKSGNTTFPWWNGFYDRLCSPHPLPAKKTRRYRTIRRPRCL